MKLVDEIEELIDLKIREAVQQPPHPGKYENVRLDIEKLKGKLAKTFHEAGADESNSTSPVNSNPQEEAFYKRAEASVDVPRRIRLDLNTPAELAIRNAVNAVEAAGAHPLLTDAVTLLNEAREKVADFVELK